MRLDVFSGGFLIRATDLANEDDAARIRIGLEQLEAIDEVHAADRISADADAGRLA